MEQTPSPFSAGDAVFNSTAGVIGNIVAGVYADNLIEDAFAKSAGLNKDFTVNSKERAELKNRNFRESSSWKDYNNRNEVFSKVDQAIGRQTDGAGYSRARHHMRRSVRNSSIVKHIGFKGFGDEGKFGFQLKNFIDSPDKRARKIGLRQAAGELADNPNIPSALRDSLKSATRARAFGVTAFALGVAQVGFEMGGAVMEGLAAKGRKVRSKGKTPAMAQGGFEDTRMAYTTRQHAMRAIQLGQSGMRRALGAEAEYLHSFN